MTSATRRAVVLAGTASLVMFTPPLVGAAMAKNFKERDLIGVWRYVAAEQRFPNGTIVRQFGDPPKGLFSIARSGDYSHVVMRPDLPNVASGRIAEMTPEEALAIAQGSLSHFGRWEWEADGEDTFTVVIENSTFPNFDGIRQVRVIRVLDENTLMYENLTTTGGGGVVVYAELERIADR